MRCRASPPPNYVRKVRTKPVAESVWADRASSAGQLTHGEEFRSTKRGHDVSPVASPSRPLLSHLFRRGHRVWIATCSSNTCFVHQVFYNSRTIEHEMHCCIIFNCFTTAAGSAVCSPNKISFHAVRSIGRSTACSPTCWSCAARSCGTIQAFPICRRTYHDFSSRVRSPYMYTLQSLPSLPVVSELPSYNVFLNCEGSFRWLR